MGGLGRIWANSCSQNRLQEPRGRHRLSTVIQPLRQNAGEVVDLTVDEDGKSNFRKICHPSTSIKCLLKVFEDTLQTVNNFHTFLVTCHFSAVPEVIVMP